MFLAVSECPCALFITAALSAGTKGDEKVVPKTYRTVSAREVRQARRNRQKAQARSEVDRTRTKVEIPGYRTKARRVVEL